MSNRLRICDAQDNLLCSLPYVVLPDLKVLTFALKAAFPNLKTTPFEIAFLGTDNSWEPYSPGALPPRCRNLRLHAQGNHAELVVVGCILQQQADSDELLHSRDSTPPTGSSRKASKHSSHDSPASSSSSQHVSARQLEEEEEEELRRKMAQDEKKGLQAAMRAECMRRDQCCVLTGDCDDANLKCCLVLTPEYGTKWVT
ncbi:hypothetical protein HDU86_001419 [Geranomyces michiganensis]|nr:hypothetical protein HDU86_001419 [Geranomyces michiganensis]